MSEKKVRNPKEARRQRVKRGIRKSLHGSEGRPRLTVYRSNASIYAQIIDDLSGKTLVSCSSRIKNIDGKKITKTEKSVLVGKLLAEKAKAAGVSQVVFDRNGFKYHGRVKALAEGAREGGLQF
ncbi:MAG: 50S ribosomal protein L18 [Bacteroidetes bacterium]|jgi:large subunit ribosomal protein L18|nr:50S ribosomal protein L18 [Bacteroidota bacterium]